MAKEEPRVVDRFSSQGVNHELEFNQFNEIQRPVGFREGAEASLISSARQSSTASVFRIMKINDAEEEGLFLGQKPLSPQRLNRMFPEVIDPFKRPMTLNAAKVVVERQKEKRKLAIARQNSSTFAGIVGFGLSIPVHAFDPIDLGAGIVTGGILGVAMKGTRLAKIFGFAGKSFSKLTAGQQFRSSAITGTIGNIIVEPIAARAAQLENENYGLAQVVANSAMGGFGFAGARFLGGKAFGAVGKLSNNVKAKLMKSSIGQVAEGKSPNMEPLIREAATPDAIYPPGRSYDYQKIDGTAMKGRRFYIAANRSDPEFKSARRIGDDLGDGVYLTDDPFKVNEVAVGKHGDVSTRIIEAELDDLNIIDLDNRLDLNNTRDISIRDSIRDVVGEKYGRLLDTETPRVVYDKIFDDVALGRLEKVVLRDLDSKLEKVGFDGTLHDGMSNVRASESTRSNYLRLFNSSKIKAQSSIKPEISLSHAKSRQLADGIKSNDDISDGRYLFGDPQSREAYNKRIADVDKKLDVEVDVEPDKALRNELLKEDSLQQELELARNQGLIGDEEIKILKASKEEGDLFRTAYKVAFTCLTGGG